MNKVDSLKHAIQVRDQEILEYQINIDNYTRSIEKITERHIGSTRLDIAMRDFAKHLAEMAETSTIEQRKAMTIREVMIDQLSEIGEL